MISQHLDNADLWQQLAECRDTDRERFVQIRNDLFLHYHWLLKSIARRSIQYSVGIPCCEIESAGVEGLLQAVERFDPSRGYKFETYAAWRIRGAIIDYFRSVDPNTRAYHRARRECLTQRDVKDLECRSLLSLDQVMHDLDVVQVLAVSNDPAGGLPDCGYLLRGLSKRHRLVALLVFVFGESQAEAADQLGLSESRVSQMLPSIRETIRANAARAA